MRIRRRFWTAVSGILALVAIAGLTPACHRKSPSPPPDLPPTKPQPAPAAQQPAEEPPDVLVGIGSIPPGARMVRVRDGFVLGYTPETIEFRRSSQPVPIRFELEGYVPVTREVPAASDAELWIELKPIPTKHSPASKKSKASKAP